MVSKKARSLEMSRALLLFIPLSENQKPSGRGTLSTASLSALSE